MRIYISTTQLVQLEDGHGACIITWLQEHVGREGWKEWFVFLDSPHACFEIHDAKLAILFILRWGGRVGTGTRAFR